MYSGGRTITNRLRTIQIQWTIDPANYRKHLEKRRSRLRKTRGEVVKNPESSGLELYREEEDGLFIWARRDPSENATSLAAAAAKQGIVPAPGALFRPYQEVSPWLRFNAAGCENPAVFRVLQTEPIGGS